MVLALGVAIAAPQARADFFGGDVAVLLQILAEQIKQYYQLRSIIENGRGQLDLLRQVNAGIDNSIALIRTLPIKDERVLADITRFQEGLRRVGELYGQIPKSPEEALHLIQDKTVAESLKMASEFKGYSEQQEKNSEVIAVQARLASPKGAARMQAATSAEILRSLSQLLRLNTQLLKLQSEQLAMNNKRSKDVAANFQRVNEDLGRGFSTLKLDMGLTSF
jgi:hypothetical protein